MRDISVVWTDDIEFRKKLTKCKIKITSVPTLVFVYDSGEFEKYQGDAVQWILSRLPPGAQLPRTDAPSLNQPPKLDAWMPQSLIPGPQLAQQFDQPAAQPFGMPQQQFAQPIQQQFAQPIQQFAQPIGMPQQQFAQPYGMPQQPQVAQPIQQPAGGVSMPTDMTPRSGNFMITTQSGPQFAQPYGMPAQQPSMGIPIQNGMNAPRALKNKSASEIMAESQQQRMMIDPTLSGPPMYR